MKIDSIYKIWLVPFFMSLWIGEQHAFALSQVPPQQEKGPPSPSLPRILPQRIAVVNSTEKFRDCGDLKPSDFDKDSLVIVALDGPHPGSKQGANAEFWVVKPTSPGSGSNPKKNPGVKTVSISCHFKKNFQETLTTDRINGLASNEINQRMANAITPDFNKKSSSCTDYLNPYSVKSFAQQIDEHIEAQAKSEKPEKMKEPEALLNTILGAVGVEVFAGANWVDTTGDGTWRQDMHYPSTIHSVSADYGAGLSIKPNSKDEIRVGFQHLLDFSINALANASDYNVGACHEPGSKVECWPLSHWNSKGGVNQIYLTYGRKFLVYGIPIIAEVGVNANQATYTVTVPDYNGGGPADGPAGSPHFLEVKTQVKTRINGSFGVGIQPLPEKLPRFTLMATAEFPVGASHVEIPTGYYGFAVNLNARYRFCFLEGGSCDQ